MTRGTMLARALGLFSLGIGAIQVVAPRRFARWTGIERRTVRRGEGLDRVDAVRAIGAREVGAAVGLLSRPLPVGWSWFRLGGDAMDLALLAQAARARGVRRDRVTTMMFGVLAVAVLDLFASLRLTRTLTAPARERQRQRERFAADEIDATAGAAWGSTEAIAGSDERLGERAVGPTAESVRATVTVDRSPEEAYGLWRDFASFPRFMHHVEEVAVSEDGRHSHWRAKGPAGTSVEWDAVLTEDRPNELISWRSVQGSDVHHAGTVRFVLAPPWRGTEVHVEMEYAPPAGPLGVVVAKLFGEDPKTQVTDDLRRFKQVLETGEVVLSEAIAEGRKVRQRPAQPLDPEEAR